MYTTLIIIHLYLDKYSFTQKNNNKQTTNMAAVKFLMTEGLLLHLLSFYAYNK